MMSSTTEQGPVTYNVQTTSFYLSISRSIANRSALPELQASINGTSSISSSVIVSSSVAWQIVLYSMIFFLSVSGNTLVILTLVQNRRMRTITNVFLLNLAISDLFLGVLCMPITLVGTLRRDFIFGPAMCKLLPFLQASSIAVSAWTLVAISIERYYAICHPLSSRRWQTLNHARRVIACVWCGSFICMMPISVYSKLIPTSNGHHKCRERWPNNAESYERAYNIMLDLILLVLPLLLLTITYSLITRTLWKTMSIERAIQEQQQQQHPLAAGLAAPQQMLAPTNTSSSFCEKSYNHTMVDVPSVKNRIGLSTMHGTSHRRDWRSAVSSAPANSSCSIKFVNFRLRRTNVAQNLSRKKRVIKMLFVIVLEFFICWTPLYIINTIVLFDPAFVYQNLGYTAISFLQLLAYMSSCCNPITYCFMNCGFRKAFSNSFRCLRRRYGSRTRRRSSMCGALGPPSEMETTKLQHSHRSESS